LKYYWRDYVLKKPYKEIVFNGEFQQELINVLPFAYWHFKNGTLKTTASAKYTAPFYFFSPDHSEKYVQRDWTSNYSTEIPNSAHNFCLDKSKWLRVPLKEKYKNEKFTFERPILIIANRYNIEWEKGPISFFDIPILNFIIDTLGKKYQIIYNRPSAENITNDNSEILNYGDYQFLKESCRDVILLNDLYETNKGSVSNFNHLQLMVYANANAFISIHGGTATLASYFGGTNVIYSKEGHEHYFREFETIFPELSGAKIIHAKDENELKNAIKLNF
jgi:hypothetical protein